MSIGSLNIPLLIGQDRAGLRESLGRMANALIEFLSRPRRVIGLLLIIWTLNVADLSFTIQESDQRLFRELNPVAAKIIQWPPIALVAYKLSLVVVASTILIRLRRQRVVELSCWFLLAVYGYVGMRWNIYYGELTVAMSDPAVFCVETMPHVSYGRAPRGPTVGQSMDENALP